MSGQIACNLLIGSDPLFTLSLIERYVFRKAALATFGAAGGLIAVIWIVRAVQEVNIVMNKGQGILTYLTMISLGVPTLTAAILPLALLIGLVRTINQMNGDTELVVLHASGASRTTLLRPFLAVSAMVAVLVLVLHTLAGPASMSKLRSYITEMRADLVSVVIQEGRFIEVNQALTFHVASRAPGGILQGVFIHDMRDPDLAQTYLAERGNVVKLDGDAYLVLENGQIQRQNAGSNNVSTIRYDSYAFDLSSYGNSAATEFGQMELSTAELLSPSPDSVLYQSAPGRYRAELHTRLTGWLHALAVGFLVLVYLGDPISNRQGQNFVIFACCTVAIGTKALGVVAEGAARESIAAIGAMWALPLTAIGLSILLLIADRKALPDNVSTSAERFGRAIVAWIRRKLPTLAVFMRDEEEKAETVA
jgi:lipopolysaccharide export system permease protein